MILIKKIILKIFDLKLYRGIVYLFLFKKLRFPFYVYKNTYIGNCKNITFGKNITVGFGAFINPLKLEVGDNTWIGVNCFLCGNAKIGKNVMIGPNVVIPGAEHKYQDLIVPMINQGLVIKGTIIDDNVWIGGNSVILDGVKIGKNSIIAAGSVVTKNVDENCIVAGIPAIKIKSRD